MSKETSRSFTIEKTPLKNEVDYIYEENGENKQFIDTKDRLEEVLDKKFMRRSAFPPDQRGSVNTEMRQIRLRNRLLTNRGSVAVSSVYSQARTEFSFHPSINHGSKWKPKYDDHHNHRKMWRRMHAENDKIKQKNRLRSQQKEIEELSKCTFTPEIYTRPKNPLEKQKKHKPQDVKQLSLRLYQYADLFKEKRETLKEKIESERGEEMRFTPKISTTKSSGRLQTVKEKTKNSDIVLIGVKQPGSIVKKRSKYYEGLGSQSARKSHAKATRSLGGTPGFSTSLYTQRSAVDK